MRTGKSVIDAPVEGFEIDDLFFSRTDPRGVIQSCNTVFVRLSGYGLDELLVAPHKRVRHPDMPRAVFRLMWDQLKAGNTFVGYVKNLAKSGHYYWVFSLVVPVDGGFMSVRLKPTTATLEKIRDLYSEVRKQEIATSLGPADGIKMIDAAISKFGSQTYCGFIVEAMDSEMAARAEALGRAPDPDANALLKVREGLTRLRGHTHRIMDMMDLLRGAPTNLAIESTRHPGNVGTLKVIAQNYTALSEQIDQSVTAMRDGMSGLLHSADEARLAYLSYRLLSEAIPRFAAEAAEIDVSLSGEAAFLQDTLPMFEAAIPKGYGHISEEASNLLRVVRDLKRIVSGLAMARVMCRMEAAHMTGDVSRIEAIVQAMDTFQSDVGGALDSMVVDCESLVVLARNAAKTRLTHAA